MTLLFLVVGWVGLGLLQAPLCYAGLLADYPYRFPYLFCLEGANAARRYSFKQAMTLVGTGPFALVALASLNGGFGHGFKFKLN